MAAGFLRLFLFTAVLSPTIPPAPQRTPPRAATPTGTPTSPVTATSTPTVTPSSTPTPTLTIYDLIPDYLDVITATVNPSDGSETALVTTAGAGVIFLGGEVA